MPRRFHSCWITLLAALIPFAAHVVPFAGAQTSQDEFAVQIVPQQGSPAEPGLLENLGAGTEVLSDDVVGESETVRERYPDTKIKIERQVALDKDRNYVNHGSWTHYDPEGNVLAQGEFRHGRRHGPWIKWYAPGTATLFEDPLYQGFEQPFRSEVNLRDGKLDGTWTIFDAQDRMASQWEFENGVRHGKSIWWFPNGTIAREVLFQDGQLDGELVDYNPEQEVVNRISFAAGLELVKEIKWHNDVQKKFEGWGLRSREIVNPSYDWWNGVVKMPVAKSSTPLRRHGKWIFWHTTGEELADGEYFLGNKIGKWKWSFSNGQTQARGEFIEGLPHGRWSWWYENGHRQCAGRYERGEEVGVWSSWRDDGKLVQILDYSTPAASAEEPDAEMVQAEPATPPEPVEEVPMPDLQSLRVNLSQRDHGSAH